MNSELNLEKFPLSTRIGIIGGGQLGKMMALEAKKMGFYVSILDPTFNCPAHSVCDNHIVAHFDDKDAIFKLSNCSNVITYEFEHIDYKSLIELQSKNVDVFPTPKSLMIIQDKFNQKTKMAQHFINVPKFMKIDGISDILKASERFGYPFLLKTCTGGYDGKGNYLIRSVLDIEHAYKTLGYGNINLMAEEFVPFIMEVSALTCRSENNEIAVYPIAQNTHKNNILIETRVPADISESTKENAILTTTKVMEILGGVGMFCVEMFILENGEVYVNEVAPRPHNSGHYSIEGCVTNQFEQHIRAITGLPLGDTTLIRPTVMRNILGEEGYCGKTLVIGANEALKISGAKLHLYGKEEVKAHRKMGHITVTASTLSDAVCKCELAASKIKVIGEGKI